MRLAFLTKISSITFLITEERAEQWYPRPQSIAQWSERFAQCNPAPAEQESGHAEADQHIIRRIRRSEWSRSSSTEFCAVVSHSERFAQW